MAVFTDWLRDIVRLGERRLYLSLHLPWNLDGYLESVPPVPNGVRLPVRLSVNGCIEPFLLLLLPVRPLVVLPDYLLVFDDRAHIEVIWIVPSRPVLVTERCFTRMHAGTVRRAFVVGYPLVPQHGRPVWNREHLPSVEVFSPCVNRIDGSVSVRVYWLSSFGVPSQVAHFVILRHFSPLLFCQLIPYLVEF